MSARTLPLHSLLHLVSWRIHPCSTTDSQNWRLQWTILFIEMESVSTCLVIILPRERLRLLTTSVGVMEHSGRNCTEEFDICGRNPCGPETVPPSWGGITMKVNAPRSKGLQL